MSTANKRNEKKPKENSKRPNEVCTNLFTSTNSCSWRNTTREAGHKGQKLNITFGGRKSSCQIRDFRFQPGHRAVIEETMDLEMYLYYTDLRVQTKGIN